MLCPVVSETDFKRTVELHQKEPDSYGPLTFEIILFESKGSLAALPNPSEDSEEKDTHAPAPVSPSEEKDTHVPAPVSPTVKEPQTSSSGNKAQGSLEELKNGPIPLPSLSHRHHPAP